MVIGMGSNRAISTSNIMKITAIRKNRDEKWSRAEFFGSNPHSNGDLFLFAACKRTRKWKSLLSVEITGHFSPK